LPIAWTVVPPFDPCIAKPPQGLLHVTRRASHWSVSINGPA
jgi:hypothetical protein